MMLSEMDNIEGIGTEEHVAVGSCNNNDATHVIKRKRTKRRLKPLSPCGVAATVTSSCSSASGGGGSFSSTTFEGTDQEEEDMANCLILLAQGKGGEANPHHHHHHHHHLHKHKQPTENHVDGDNKMTERATKSGFYIYECKTCNRTFPSFQALGGHRASHKKPKTQEEKKSSPPPLITSIGHDQFEEADYKQNQIKNNNIIISSSPPISLQLGYCGVAKPLNKTNKIHECSICGSEFTSGQALGGHMRRHRASINNNHVADVVVKSRNVLELDLNLPAPEDDLRDSTFQFPATQKSVVLSAAPALVGCHY